MGFIIRNSEFIILNSNWGLAQLARAPALHAGGHRFDSDILHQSLKGKFQKEIPKSNYWNLEFKFWDFPRPKFIDILRYNTFKSRKTQYTVLGQCIQNKKKAISKIRAYGGCLGSQRRRRT